VGRVDDDEVVGRDDRRLTGVGRIGLVRPVSTAVGVWTKPFLAEHAENSWTFS
jgi:hypothetical protein